MSTLKKCICFFLLAVLLLQIAPVRAEAVSTSVSGYRMEDRVLQIQVTQDGEEEDFVDRFPEIDMSQLARRVRPSVDLVNQKRQEYVNVPLYLQNDYPDILYGDGTIETSGCSVTSLAMVATYLTGYEYMPDELAYYFGGRAINNMDRLQKGAKALGLTYTKPENWHKTLAELKKGKCAIVLVNSTSDFSDSQHFIVLTGVSVTEHFNEDGIKIKEDVKVFVNDPYGPNYEHWELREGFQEGFDEHYIIQGYEGAWVFDKADIPEDYVRYVEAQPDNGDIRYPEIELSFAERQLLARVVWAEARGESEEGQQAVAEVVLNRMASGDFPDDIRDVIYGEEQFRSVSVLGIAQPGKAQYDAIERAIYGPYILPENVVYFATFAVNENIWGTIGGHIFCYGHDKTPEIPEEKDAEAVPESTQSPAE